MSPENDRDSRRFKLPYFATCLRQVGSLKKHYIWTEWVGMAGSDVIGCTKGGATASVKLIFISNFLQSTIILQKQHVQVNQELHSVLWYYSLASYWLNVLLLYHGIHSKTVKGSNNCWITQVYILTRQNYNDHRYDNYNLNKGHYNNR